MGLIETILNFDRQIFLFLNGLHSITWDWIMFMISNKFVWIPLYAYFVYFIFTRTQKKILVLITVIAMVAITDICASQIAKPTFERLRPCHDSSLENVHTVNNKCGKQYGFFSSHASNVFGLATFFFLLFKSKNTKKNYLWLLYLWAFATGYSRIYLGVHFPLDVITGFVCGFLVAKLAFFTLIKLKAI